MKYEKPEMTVLTSNNERVNASGPDGGSERWSGCCYR